MPTPVQLATGLGGAIGSDYVLSRNQLYFVEYNGNISRLDLVRPLEAVVFSGTVTMPANSSLDLSNGTSAQGGDIRWDHTSPGGTLVMRPQGNCTLSTATITNFDTITHAELQNPPYTQNSIPGEGAANQLTAGAVFGVFNSSRQPAANFDYAKVVVLSNAAGSIKVQWVSYRVKPRYSVIGTGYAQPEDIKVTSGGRYAYVTERTGNLLRVDLTNANRGSAQLIASGLNTPHQISLDEAHGQAYVGEYTTTATGKIWRIDLSGSIKTPLFTGLEACTGILVTKDLRYAFVAEQASGGNRIARINLITGQREKIIINTLTAPFFMEWGDDNESRIILAERDPANRITIVDLSANPVSATALLSGVPNRPSSCVLSKPGTLLVCSDSVITQYDISSSLFSLTGPLFMGIGLIPVDHIINATPADNNTDGYADTTDNPGYLLRVKDAPFGGTLAIMINHNAALLAGATYYKLSVTQITPVAGVLKEPRQGFSDYLWNPVTSRFEPRTITPDADGFYPVRKPLEVWYNPLLGYTLDTTILGNGLYNIDITIYNAAKGVIGVGSIHNRKVKIDNQWPVANIEKILHDGVEVPVCTIVNSGTDQFQFQITATDPQGHLLSWSMSALWGDNKSKDVGSDSYQNHISPSRQWAGVLSGVVPAPAWIATVTGDPTSTRCAHTFYLGVWDRVINGYGYIHYQTYHKSITIWL